MSLPDTDITNYTIAELFTILDLDESDATTDDIIQKTNLYINKFKRENNPDMVSFFNNIQTELLDDLETTNTAEQKQNSDWWQNEVLQQSDKTQSDKNTDRKQKIDVYKNIHLPMKKEQLGVSNTFSIPVAQDSLNPNLKNITSRIIVLDSQFRQTSAPSETSTDYMLDLSEPLLNVLSLRLYSIQIPYTWYTIDTMYGNTCLWITFVDDISVAVNIEPGNYSGTEFILALTTAFTNAGFVFTNTVPIIYSSTNGKITLNLFGGTYNNNNNIINITETTIITFFDFTNQLKCKTNCVQTLAINQTLGWIMGFRLPFINVLASPGNTGEAIMDLYGPKYFILVIDDLNQNHINSGLIGITELSKTLKLPTYYSPDLPYICIPAKPNGPNLKSNSEALANDINAGTLLMDKLDATYSPTQQLIPSAPRILTQTQIYSINEIIKNNEKTYNYKLKAPTTTDTFAIIPLKLGKMTIGDAYVEFGGTLQDNKRVYFGPVNIERLRIKLLDDKGNIVNLNGCDWCITLISENLYQY